MDTPFSALTQTELIALALEAARRHQSGHTMAYLKEACAREDATAQAHFLLGSEYAQLLLSGEAFTHLKRAVELAPDFALARFQLGLLHLTHAQADQALESWAPLKALDANHPLHAFAEGLGHLILDEFTACVTCLERGISLNTENPALNNDMQSIIERVKSGPLSGASQENAEPAESTEQSHLFLNAYKGGQVH